MSKGLCAGRDPSSSWNNMSENSPEDKQNSFRRFPSFLKVIQVNLNVIQHSCPLKKFHGKSQIELLFFDSRKLSIYQKIRFFSLFVEVMFLVYDISKVEAEICQLQILGCLEHKGWLITEQNWRYSALGPASGRPCWWSARQCGRCRGTWWPGS